MDKIHSFIRKLHLYALFIIASFLLMYFLTGAIMIMGKVFPRKNIKSVSEKVALERNLPEANFINDLLIQYDIHGTKLMNSTSNGGRTFSFIRPGYRAEIIFHRGQDSVQIRIRQGNFWSAMNDFHRLRGFSTWPHIIWALLYDLSSIALLVFAFTGVYLWWKLERKKRTGIIFIFLSTGLTVFTIWYLMAVG